MENLQPLHLRSALLWNNCSKLLPPINTTILFSFSNEVHIGYMDQEGYFFSNLSWLANKVTEPIAVAIADHLYEDTHSIKPYWLLDKEEGEYPFVNRWIFFNTDILPKINITIDKLEQLQSLNKYSEWEIHDLVFRRVHNFLNELYDIDNHSYIIPTIYSIRKSIYIEWKNIEKNRKVYTIFNSVKDELHCEGISFNHIIFPFDATRLPYWLDWINK